jgi:serine protease
MREKIACVLAVAAVLELASLGCKPAEKAPSPSPSPAAKGPTQAELESKLKDIARRDRDRFVGQSFEQFKAGVYKEPFAGGKFIVNGDTPILDEKQLREFFDTQVKPQPRSRNELIVHQVQGVDAVWNLQQQRALTYCVSTTFGQRHAQVVQEMETATGAWEQAAAVDFVHQAAQDANCAAANASVVFDVRPVDVGGSYLARAFFPNEPRSARNVLIDETSFTLDPAGKLQLAGVLRHELGHALGFRHEHTRPSSGACFEDNDWRPITPYDASSVMHYPQCNGRGDWSLVLTAKDKSGSACLYGAAPGFTIDSTVCQPTSPGTGTPGQPRTQTFSGQSVGLNQQKDYGPFDATPGTVFEARMSGTGGGDPDLYVRFGSKPSPIEFLCRPFLVGPNEVCSLNVPAGQTKAFVMVHGYSAGSYTLKVTHVPPAP